MSLKVDRYEGEGVLIEVPGALTATGEPITIAVAVRAVYQQSEQAQLEISAPREIPITFSENVDTWGNR